jgi:hypothetical protein
MAVRSEVLANPVLHAAARAGLTIGTALDHALPFLQSASHVRGDGSLACDVVDRRPLLCVSGESASRNDVETALLVDLGGDDVYTGSAGGANAARCAPPSDPNNPSCTVSVVLDVEGDDLYQPDPVTAAPFNHLVAFGSGMQGVGMLIDADGNDRYLAHVPADRQQSLDDSFVFGSAQMGFGLLSDFGGDDAYELTGTSRTLGETYSHGSALTGMGALLDFGGKNVYRNQMSGFQSSESNGAPSADELLNGQGVGFFGGGLLYDASGQADLETSIDVTAGTQWALGLVNPVAQGVAVGGGAAVITGSGATTYRTIARRHASFQGAADQPVRLPGEAAATGQAISALGSSFLDDAGGDDVYDVTSSESQVAIIQGSGNVVGTIDTDGRLQEDGFPTYGVVAHVSAQGLASGILVPESGSLLADHGGNDSYLARGTLHLSVTAESSDGDAAAVEIGTRFPEVATFGQGFGSDEAPGVLFDSGGDDFYDLSGISTTSADAIAPLGEGSSSAMGTFSNVYGQGSTLFDPVVGALLDTGGRDTYHATSINRTATSPDPRSARDLTRVLAAQGGAGGIFADLDSGIADEFVAVPELGMSFGFRGEGDVWVDDSAQIPGIGIAPMQPGKAPPTLELDPANPAIATHDVVPFSARLMDSAGPIPDAEVTFELQYKSFFGVPQLEVWHSHTLTSHGITDANGASTGYLDLGQFAEEWPGTSEMTLRIVARYHGDAARRATAVTAPIHFES